MNLKSLKCTNCGAMIDPSKIDAATRTAECPFCNETFIVEQAENFAKVEVDKSKDIVVFRQNLALAVEKNSIYDIKRCAGNILDILPDDYEAGYFFAYALAKIGDTSYLYDFYSADDKEYTEEACMRVVEHVINNGDLRDDGKIRAFIGKMKYNSGDYLKLFMQTFQGRVAREELYDDITRDVFICHRSTDGEIANRIVKELEADGNKCWISSRNLRPNDNQNYWDNIKRAIKSCRIFLVVSSFGAMMSNDVKKEMAFAKDLNKKRLEVKVDDSEHTAYFKDFFDGYKWIKGENHKEIKARVADLLAKELSGAGDGVVVHKVEKVNFTPIQEAKEIKKVVVDELHVHKFEKAAVVPPTCTETGYTLYRCACGEEKKTDFTPKRTEHDFRLAEEKAATCTLDGYKKYKCAYCDAVKTETAKATGHDFKLFEKKAPTCKEDGFEIYKCSVCGDTKVNPLPKIDHTYGNWLVTKLAACETQGQESRQCSFCGEVETRPTSVKGHTFGEWVTEKEPGCEEKGVKVRQCVDCGKKEHGDIAPTGHNFSEWKTLPDGKNQERVCSKCGKTETRTTEEYKKEKALEKAKRTKIISFSAAAVSVAAFVLSIIAYYVAVQKGFSVTVPFIVQVLSLVTVIVSLWSVPQLANGKGKKDGWEYVINKDDMTVTLTSLPQIISGGLTIPSKIFDFPVKSFGNIFQNNNSISTIIIQNGLDHIENFAFSCCKNLTYITIPGSVKSIGKNAFAGCVGLKAIYYEGDGGLTGWCSIRGLENIMSSSGRDLFINKSLVTGNLIIPTAVTSIGECAFAGCKGLVSVKIPDTVTSIGDYAFEYCRGLTSVTIGNSVAKIGRTAFYGCNKLKSITIPDSVKSIGQYAFKECVELASVTLGQGVTDIGGYAFWGCNSLKSITLPFNVKNVGEYAFFNCLNLTSLTIENSSIAIGDCGFFGCPIENATIPTGAISAVQKNILQNVIIKGGESIEDSAFKDCGNLTSVHISNTVKNIGSAAFYGCDKLTGVTIADSVTKIGGGAFQLCNSLTSITIPDGVTGILGYTFYKCGKLKAITFSKNVKIIGERAFCHCGALKNINYDGTSAQWKAIKKGDNWNEKMYADCIINTANSKQKV